MRATGDMKDVFASVKIGKEFFWLGPRDPKLKKLDFAFNVFIVKNIKKEVKELQRRGVKFQKAEKSMPSSKVDGSVELTDFGASAFFNDSEGNLLMMWQNARPAS